jgi:lysophospholipase L1-like esterase
MAWGKLVDETVGQSKWKDKIWVTLGDSNSAGGYTIPYQDLLKVRDGINVLNFAQGGAGWIAKSSNGLALNISEQLANAPSEADLITAMAGGNDYSLDYPLGQLGDTTLDTFYGALDLTIRAMIDKYPLKKIGIFTQMRRRVELVRPKGTSVALQAQATIDVCKKHCIPVLDLYHHGGMYPKNDVWFTECMLEDGVHLKGTGQEILADKVKTFIESL